jgi:hypothetical protein
MAGVPPNSQRQDELPDYLYQGPFGGLQSEVALSQIGRSGFAEVQNVMFRKSHCRTFPGFTPLTSPSGEIIIGLGDFFNVFGARIFVVWTPTKMYAYIGGAWIQITGASSYNVAGVVTSGVFLAGEVISQPGNAGVATVNVAPVPGAGPMSITGLTGSAGALAPWTGVTSGAVFTPSALPVAVSMNLSGNVLQFMQWDVIGYKLYFCQQSNIVMVWDGFTTSFSPASPAAVPSKYVCGLAFHLLSANTIEAGAVAAPNRIHWSGAGNGLDWTSFNSGQTDLFNPLGPINGLASVYQAGYAFQQWGITQIVPTGNGLVPFQFITMGSRSKGSILPYGVASFGEIIACYVGKDDIYIFDGTQSIGIGSHPIDGNRRLGARNRIFQDLFLATFNNIYGFIMSDANGFEYESYWLFMPSLNKAWIYHFDEQNWTQLFFPVGQLVGPCGCVPLQKLIRIQDLIGTIATQGWSPATLSNATSLDTMGISDGIADTVSFFDQTTSGVYPTNGSINITDGWYIKSGQLTFDDSRHNHTVKKFRLLTEDYSAGSVFNVRVSNEKGQSQIQTVTVGTGSGNTMTQVLAFSISGKFITWEISGPKSQLVGMVEFAPVFDVGGEVQGGNR